MDAKETKKAELERVRKKLATARGWMAGYCRERIAVLEAELAE